MEDLGLAGGHQAFTSSHSSSWEAGALSSVSGPSNLYKSGLFPSPHLILTANLGDLYCYYHPHLTDKETKAREKNGSSKITLLAKKQSQDSNAGFLTLTHLSGNKQVNVPAASRKTVKGGRWLWPDKGSSEDVR